MYVKTIIEGNYPTGMGSPFDSKEQVWSEFQVNIFSNDRDIRKCQRFCMTLLPPPLTTGL